MSLNHIVIQNTEDVQLDVHFNSVESKGLQAVCADQTLLTLNPTTSGTLGQSLQSDGNGGLIFVNTGGAGGMTFTGSLPVAGQHIKSADTTGNLYQSSTLVEDSSSFNFGSKNLDSSGTTTTNNFRANILLQTPKITSATSGIDFSNKDLNNVDVLNANDVIVTNDDSSTISYKLPSVGTLSQVLSSQGDGTLSWQNLPSFSGVTHTGIDPIAKQYACYLSTDPNIVTNARLRETSAFDLSLDGLNITNANTITANNLVQKNTDGSYTNFKLPSVGTDLQYISSDGLGNVKWESIPPPSTGNVSFNQPGGGDSIVNGLCKYVDTLGNIQNSSITEAGSSVNFSNQNITNISNVNCSTLTVDNVSFASTIPSELKQVEDNTAYITATIAPDKTIINSLLDAQTNLVKSSAIPSSNEDLTNKEYVDGLVNNILPPGSQYGDYLYWDNNTNTYQVGSNSVHIGGLSGVGQEIYAVAIGAQAGMTNQKSSAIAIGTNSGESDQAMFSISIGSSAGRVSQAAGAIAIGQNSGLNNQPYYSTCLGPNSISTLPFEVALGDPSNCPQVKSHGYFVSDQGFKLSSGGSSTQYFTTDGGVGAPTAGGSSNIYLYNSSTNTNLLTITSGQIRYNNAVQANANQICISHLTRDNIDIDAFLELVAVSNIIYIQDQNTSLNYIKYKVTAPPSISPNNYYIFTVTVLDSQGTGSTNFPNGHDIFMSIYTDTATIDARLNNLDSEVLDLQNNKLSLSGGSMTGNIEMQNNSLDHISYLSFNGTTNCGFANSNNFDMGQNVLLGSSNTNNGEDQILVGTGNTSTATGNTLGVGYVNNVDSNFGLCLGFNNTHSDSQENQICIGRNNMTSGTSSMAFGSDITNGTKNSLCIGSSNMEWIFPNSGSCALGHPGIHPFKQLYIDGGIIKTAGTANQLYCGDGSIDTVTINNAASALSLANTAQTTANTAQSTANTAQSTANTAQSTANGKVSKSGDTMTGTLNMGLNKITSSYVPVNGVDLTNKTFTDATYLTSSALTPYLLKAGDTMTGDLILHQDIYQNSRMITGTIFASSGSITLTATNTYLPISVITSVGGANVAITQSNTNTLSKIIKMSCGTTSVAAFQDSGYLGGATFYRGSAGLYVGMGWTYNICFGIGDTNTAASGGIAGMQVGFVASTTTPLWSATITPDNTVSWFGVGHNYSDSVVSFYNRGSLGTGSKISTSFSAATPSVLYFSLTMINQFNSNDVLLVLKEITTNTTVTQSYTMSGTNSVSNTTRLYPVFTRIIGATAPTGSGIISFSSMTLTA
jgi:hypothetical protein